MLESTLVWTAKLRRKHTQWKDTKMLTLWHCQILEWLSSWKEHVTNIVHHQAFCKMKKQKTILTFTPLLAWKYKGRKESKLWLNSDNWITCYWICLVHFCVWNKYEIMYTFEKSIGPSKFHFVFPVWNTIIDQFQLPLLHSIIVKK